MLSKKMQSLDSQSSISKPRKYSGSGQLVNGYNPSAFRPVPNKEALSQMYHQPQLFKMKFAGGRKNGQ